ncbi:MAG: thylakoid-associated protein [Microcystaceae cyanobacterium]
MDTKLFEDYQKQVLDCQKKLFDTWLDNLPSGKVSFNLSDNFEKTVEMQKELVTSYLEVQEQTSSMLLDAQKQLWNDYFEAIKKEPATV